MKTKTTLLSLSLLLAASTLCFANAAIGTWKLNESKSKFAPGSPKNNTVTYTAAGAKIKVTVDGVNNAGKTTHNQWTGKFDGRSYPLVGDPSADSRTYKQVSPNKLEFSNNKSGKPVVTGTIVISPDGKSRTVTTTAMDASGRKVKDIAVYDKK